MQTWLKWKKDFLFFCKNKFYMGMLGLTAVCSYGFLVTHQTVGIDDTPYAYYFEEGLNAIVGRWFLFLLNKVFHISEFSPFITDFAGVLIFMAAVTVWCTLLYSVCRDRVPLWGYTFFSCIFLSCPLISEVYTYYLHNGISVGYLCTGISICFFRELVTAVEKRPPAKDRQPGETAGKWKGIFVRGMGTAVFLFVALGCYESFMIVWLLGILLVLLTQEYAGFRCRVIFLLFLGGLAAVAALVLRSMMIAGVIGVFGLGDMRDEAVQRSVAEMLGWLFQSGAFAEFAMAVKRFYVMYGVFAYAYYPIRIFVFAVLVMTVTGIWYSLRKKNGWFALLTFGCFAVCFLLVVVEGKATLYRSAQFLPVVCGYGAFLLAYGAEGLKNPNLLNTGKKQEKPDEQEYLKDRAALGKIKRVSVLERLQTGVGRKRALYKTCSGILIFVLCVVLWNQCFDMNKWFYADWLKYESAVKTAGRIAFELEKTYDTSKPVIFTGTYGVPKSIIADAYVDYGTETFFRIKRWTDPVDEHLLEKFYRGENGVWVAQTPALSVLDWGINAFLNDEELVRFFAMHGFFIKGNRDQELFEAAMLYSADFPRFPAEGSIVDMGDYIIVHF